MSTAIDTSLRVLLIEDNPVHVRLVQALLSEAHNPSFTLTTAASLSEGLNRLNSGGFDVVLLDLTLPDSEDLETFIRVRAACAVVPIVIVTGPGRHQAGRQGRRSRGSGLPGQDATSTAAIVTPLAALRHRAAPRCGTRSGIRRCSAWRSGSFSRPPS